MKNDKHFWNLSSFNKGIDESDPYAIFDDLPVLLCRFKKDGTIFFVNKAYSKFFHSAKENIYGTKFFIHPSEFEKSDSTKPFLNSLKKQYSLRLENGSVFWI